MTKLGVIPRRIDILTEITGVDLRKLKGNCLVMNIEGLQIPVIGRSDLLKNKKAVGPPQDQADVARLEALS